MNPRVGAVRSFCVVFTFDFTTLLPLLEWSQELGLRHSPDRLATVVKKHH